MRRLAALALLSAVLVLTVGAGGLPPIFVAPNDDGVALTLSPAPVAADHPFFRPLPGTGRACATCHVPADGWSLTPATARRRFESTGGLDPLFHPSDAASSPRADVSTVEARRRAYALLLSRGLVRVGLPVPAGADFEVVAVDDPYGFASAAELSLFRRPLPATNLKFLSTVMWDGRESLTGRPILHDLIAQVDGAIAAHAPSAALERALRHAIVDFERSLLTAQAVDRTAGPLDAERGAGGPRGLLGQPFAFAINSALAQSGTPPTPRVFTLFDAWAAEAAGEARRAIARGQTLFNERRFGAPATTCGDCHNAPNAGSSSIGAFFDTGVSDEGRRRADVPLYTVRCTTGALAGRLRRTTDPGWALVTGRCVDVGKFKVPTLRGLAARPPFFHDGSAGTLADVVAFYDRRFGIGFTAEEREALAAFLRAL
jgi:cytochrome c peroxidase